MWHYCKSFWLSSQGGEWPGQEGVRGLREDGGTLSLRLGEHTGTFLGLFPFCGVGDEITCRVEWEGS